MILDPSNTTDEFEYNREKGLFLLNEEELDEDPDPIQPEIHDGLGALFQSGHYQVNEEEIRYRAGLSVFAGSGDQYWQSITAQLIKVSVAFTAQELLRGPPEPPYNGKFILGEHHLVWDDIIQKHKLFCILAARNHGKTFFLDFAYPIWQAINNPMKSGFIFSSTQDQAVRILGDIKEELESNPKLQWLVPQKKEKWGSKLIRCSNGHKIYARGFGTKVRGAHPDWIVVDDGLTDETQYSETIRTKQNDYFKAAITNMINPGGQIGVIGTPLHSDDMYAGLKKNKEYFFATFPAESNPEGDPKKGPNKVLWAARFPLKRLERKKAEIGSILYTREYLCSAISDEMSLFPTSLFRGTDVELFNLKLGMPADYWKEAGIVPYMGVDFAMSSNVQADYTVVWVMGRDKYGNRWIMDVHRGKGMPYQEQLSLINTVARKYEPALILLESNQMQRIFGDELIRTSDLPIKKFITGVQKHSLETGVPGLRVLFENKKVRIPRGDAATVELMDTWIEEMRSFTWIEGKLQSVGGHDDMVMAFWICDQAIRMGGFAFTFGDEYSNDSKSTAQLMKELTGEIQTDEGESEGQSTEDGSDEKESTVNLV